MSEKCLDIVIRLKRRKANGLPGTQRWLLDQLHSNGFPDLSESMLSSILNGQYKYRSADNVLAAADRILTESDHRSPQVVCPN